MGRSRDAPPFLWLQLIRCQSGFEGRLPEHPVLHVAQGIPDQASLNPTHTWPAAL